MHTGSTARASSDGLLTGRILRMSRTISASNKQAWSFGVKTLALRDTLILHVHRVGVYGLLASDTLKPGENAPVIVLVALHR